MTKFIIDNVVFWSHFVVLLKSNLDVQQSSHRKARGQKYGNLNFKLKKMRKANFSKLLSKLEWIVVNFIISFQIGRAALRILASVLPNRQNVTNLQEVLFIIFRCI